MRKTKGNKDTMQQEFHKGGLCVHKMLLCQEGYCSECQIHKAALHLKEADILNLKSSKTDTRVLVASVK